MSLRALGRDSVIYGVGTGINRVLGFLLIPLFTRYLSPESYGIMAMLTVLTAVLSGIFSLGTGNSLGVCYFAESSVAERGTIVWTNAALVAVTASLLCAIGLVTAPVLSRLLFRTPEHSLLVALALPALTFNAIATPLTAYLRMTQRTRAFVVLSVTVTIATLGTAVLLVVVLGRGVRGLAEAQLCGAIVQLVLSLAVVGSLLRPRVHRRWVAPLVRIGFPSVLGLGAFFFIDWADRALLERLAGLKVLGLYSVAYAFGMVMSVVGEGAFGSAWPPFFMAYVSRRDEARAVFGRVLKYCVLGFGTLTLMFFLFARPVVTLMTAPAFHAAYTVVGMVAAAYMLKVCYLVLLPPLYFERKLHVQAAIEWAAAALNIVLNFMLIPRFGMEGAAFATLAAYIALPALAYLIGRRYLHVEYEWQRIGVFAAALIIVSMASFITFSDNVFVELLVRAIVAIAFSAFAYLVVLRADERVRVSALAWSLRTGIATRPTIAVAGPPPGS